MPKPFLFLTSRDDEVVAADELEALPRLARLDPFDLVRVRMESEPFPEIDFDQWSGIIMGGSPWDAGMKDEDKPQRQRDVEAEIFDLYDRLLGESFPFLGICYGLGTMTLHLGGEVDTHHSEDISAPVLTLTQEGAADPILAGIPQCFQAFLGHHEAPSELAPGAVLLVEGPVAPVQMIRVGDAAWMTQFHPELDLAGIEVRIREYADRGYYSPEDRPLIEAAVRAADVSSAHLVLQNFVSMHQR